MVQSRTSAHSENGNCDLVLLPACRPSFGRSTASFLPAESGDILTVVSGSLCIAHFHITLFGSSRAGVLRQGCERDCLHKAEGAHAQAGSRGHVNRRPFCLLACGAKSHYFGVHRVSMWSGGERPSL